MPTWAETEDILRPFREWLSHTADEIDALSEREGHPSAGEFDPHNEFVTNELLPQVATNAPLSDVGLLPLVEAFTAMRHELKLQTKGTRSLESSVEKSLDGLAAASKAFHAVQAQEQQAADRAARPLVEALIGLDEGLLRAGQAFDGARQQLVDAVPGQVQQSLDEQFARLPWWRRLMVRRWHRTVTQSAVEAMRRAAQENFGAVTQGFELLQTRLARSLDGLDIRRLDQPGEKVDPNRMTVVELVTDTDGASETVVEVVRPGYAFGAHVVRFAEVKATAAHAGS